VGRPRLRWLDEIKKDLHGLKVGSKRQIRGKNECTQIGFICTMFKPPNILRQAYVFFKLLEKRDLMKNSWIFMSILKLKS
jgi:hypothetical protein